MTSPVLAAKLALALARLVRDPARLDVVFALSDALLGDCTATAELSVTLQDSEIARACRARLRTPALDMRDLEAAPAGTLGRAAGEFFRAHDLDPGALPRKDATNDVEWLASHLYETHDLWHVVTGFQPNVAGELGLQAFYATQLSGPFPLTILSAGMLNTLFFASDQTDERLASIARGWRMGKRAARLIGVDWSTLLGRPLDEVRRELGIDVEDDVVPRPAARIAA